MKNTNMQIDEYLNNAPEEWKILCVQIQHICLDKQFNLTEEWKWGPNYSYHGLVVGWAYFKNHIKITFFNGNAMAKTQHHFNHCLDNAFNRSIIIDAKNPFNEKSFRACIKESIAVNKKGYKREGKRKDIEIPEAVSTMLSKNKKLKNTFEALAPSHKREYVQWITEAKRDETRERRLEKMKELLGAGKDLHSKYR